MLCILTLTNGIRNGKQIGIHLHRGAGPLHAVLWFHSDDNYLHNNRLHSFISFYVSISATPVVNEIITWITHLFISLKPTKFDTNLCWKPHKKNFSTWNLYFVLFVNSNEHCLMNIWIHGTFIFKKKFTSQQLHCSNINNGLLKE